MVGVLRLLTVLLVLVACGSWGSQGDGHTLSIRIPPILHLEVKELGLRVDTLAPHPPLILGEGRYTVRVVANTAWTLTLEGPPHLAQTLEGRGRLEVAVTVPPGAEVRLVLRPKG